MRHIKQTLALVLSLCLVVTGFTTWESKDTKAEEGAVRYEAEDADYFEQGSASDAYSLAESENYSGGYAVGNMNTWPDDGRSYCETTVNVDKAGEYTITIGYAGGEENHPCTIDVRVNDGEWISIEAAPTAAWDVVETISATIVLDEGDNVIDVTGACNIWYEGMSWEWINLDYFEIEYAGEADDAEETEDTGDEEPQVETVRYEAEDADSFEQGSSSDEYSLEESENYSGGYAVGNMNTWPEDGRAYCETTVNVDKAGDYTITIGYAGGEENHPCTIDVRVNGGEWISIEAAPTEAWDVVGTVSSTISLVEGDNVIDVTGACNIWYEGMGWEWINLDYFELTYLGETVTDAGEDANVSSTDTSSVTASDTTAAATVKAPGKAKIKKAVNVKGKKVKLTLKKVKNASGYQVEYSLKKTMKKAKSKTTAKTTLTVKKLKKKTYYFRARAYAKDAGKKVYGKWSAVKKVKVKK